MITKATVLRLAEDGGASDSEVQNLSARYDVCVDDSAREQLLTAVTRKFSNKGTHAPQAKVLPASKEVPSAAKS